MQKLNFIIILLLSPVILNKCEPQPNISKKINALSFVASNDTINQTHIEPVLSMNANWVSVMPFGFMKTLDSPKLYYNHTEQWYGERTEGVKQSIEMMHKNKIKVMLKPQIWIGRGDFTGEINFQTEAEWEEFQKQYKAMLLEFAIIAEETNTEMLCIGTELNSFVSQRPEFWKDLIKSLKEIYSGKLTYAENWDKISKVPFWPSLDYIGVDAYFPISNEETPKLENVIKRWDEIKKDLKNLSYKNQKPILFTEFGYRSINHAGKAPWNSDRVEGQVNEVAQSVLLTGLIDSIWHEEWFVGGFLWKWFHAPDLNKARQENRFSVYGKQAQKVVSDAYDKYK